MIGSPPPSPWSWWFFFIITPIEIGLMYLFGSINAYVVVGITLFGFLILNLECNENSPVEKLSERYGDNRIGAIFLVLLVISLSLLWKGTSLMELKPWF